MAPVSENINRYKNTWLTSFPQLNDYCERETLDKFTAFLSSGGAPFERSNPPGHFTGSAMVVNSDFSKILLTLHAKLDKWLQLGGHADGDADLSRVAQTEAQEESGIEKVKFLNYEKKLFPKSSPLISPLPFDWDVHLIPEYKEIAAHLHFDVRYLMIVDETKETFTVSTESQDLRWLTLAEAKALTSEQSMLRQFHKIEILHDYL